MQAPDAETIKAAITDEAKRRGIESLLKEDAPPQRPRRNLNLPPELLDMDSRIMELLEQALGGRIMGGLVPAAGGDEEAEAQEEVSRWLVVAARSAQCTVTAVQVRIA